MGVLMYHDRNYSGTPCWQGTMSDYNALSVHDPNTMYFITDETGSCILWRGTRAMFDALPDADKNDNTLYVITDEDVTINADNVAYDNTESGLTATDVQSAIDEIAQSGGGGGSAEETTYDNSSSGLDATNVQDAIDEVSDKFDGLPIPMQYKGTIGTGGTIQSLPSPSSDNSGFVYKVITEGDYLLSTSIHAKVGDIFISTGLEWTYIPSGDEANSFAELSDTNISNPTNGQVPIYNATSGKWVNGNSSGSSGTFLTQTLVAGQTTLTFTNAVLTASSLVSVYVEHATAEPYNIDDSTEGTVILTFDAQATNMVVKLKVETE